MPKPNHFRIIKNFISNNQSFSNLFQYNLMTKDIEFIRDLGKSFWNHGKYLKDEDLVHIKDYISEIMNEEYNTTKIAEAVLIISKRKTYHPIKDFLSSLKWDGISRLENWLHLTVGCEKNQYTSDVGKKVLCGAVNRIFNPGCKFDYMMILEGDQGIGKSTMLEILGGQWYLDTFFNSDKKDMVDIMRTAWIMEIADMAGFSKSDIQNLRSFISRKVDRVRLPYDKLSQDFPRQCIMIGTHNPSGDNRYFRDDTGNRRYWPIECNKIDIDYLKNVRDQLWAETMTKYKTEPLFLDTQESLDILSYMHSRRESMNPYSHIIDAYIKNKDSFSMPEIIQDAFHLDTAKITFKELRSRQTYIGIHMRKLKWEKDGDTYIRSEKKEYEQNKILWEEEQ